MVVYYLPMTADLGGHTVSIYPPIYSPELVHPQLRAFVPNYYTRNKKERLKLQELVHGDGQWQRRVLSQLSFKSTVPLFRASEKYAPADIRTF